MLSMAAEFALLQTANALATLAHGFPWRQQVFGEGRRGFEFGFGVLVRGPDKLRDLAQGQVWRNLKAQIAIRKVARSFLRRPTFSMAAEFVLLHVANALAPLAQGFSWRE